MVTDLNDTFAQLYNVWPIQLMVNREGKFCFALKPKFIEEAVDVLQKIMSLIRVAL